MVFKDIKNLSVGANYYTEGKKYEIEGKKELSAGTDF